MAAEQMDSEADIASFRNNWIASRALTAAAPEDDEAGVIERNVAEAIFERWHNAGRVRDLLPPLLEDEDPFIRYIAADRLLAFDRGAVLPESAIRTLEELVATSGDAGDGARALLATQMQVVNVEPSAVDRMVAVLQDAELAGAEFSRPGLLQPISVDAQLKPLATALRERRESAAQSVEVDRGNRVTLSWFLAINVLNVLDAMGNRNLLMDGDLEYKGSPIDEAAELGEILFEALKPPPSDWVGRNPTFILWSSDWEIVG